MHSFIKNYIYILAVFSILMQGCGGGSSNNSSNGIGKDITPPVITLKGDQVIRLLTGQKFTDPGATAFDDKDGDITASLERNSTVDTSTAGNYKVTYFVTDKAGNHTEISRTVRVFFKPVSDIYINEFLANNNFNRMDPDFYAFSDWIELYNNSNQKIDLSGYGLSDKEGQESWKIPDGTFIDSHSYKIFWADKRNTGNHTNFSLGRKGEEIILYNKSGNIIDRIAYEKQKADISYSRNNHNLWEYTEPTFQKANVPGVLTTKRTEKPQFSVSGGFYNDTKQVTISAENGAEIHYTLDGSYPSKDSALYKGQPVSVTTTSVLKAVAYKKGLIKSKDVVASYFINPQTATPVLPVVSLSTNPDYFFDDMIGIYVTGTNGRPLKECRASETENHNYAQPWDRPVHIEYFDDTEQRARQFDFNLDIAITGQCSRHNPKKSFSLELDGKYGTKSLKYKLYPGKNINKFKDFRLRAGELGYKIRDLISVKIVEEAQLNIDYEAYRTVQLFLNGEYWGIYNIREKKGLEYLKSNYPDIDTDNIDMIGVKVKAGDRKEYDDLDLFVKNNNLSIEQNYQKVISEIDEASFIDYMILEIYSGNDDWPFNNFRVWRDKSNPDSKWRWVLEDLDYGFVAAHIDLDNFARARQPGVLTTDLFNALLENNTFKNKFKSRFNELLNSIFSPEKMLSIINEISYERRAYMNFEPVDWNIKLLNFDYDIDNVIKPFARQRRDAIKTQLDNL